MLTVIAYISHLQGIRLPIVKARMMAGDVAQLVWCLPGMPEASALISRAAQKQAYGTCCNPSTWEVEAGG